MIAPIDIEKKDFSKSIGGYNKDEVDNFLNLIIVDIEEYQKTIAKLKVEKDALREQMAEYSKQQGNLTETLSSAKTLLADISESAEKRAALILKNAESEANMIVKDAKSSMLSTTKELEILRNKVSNFNKRYKKMLQEELDSFQDESSIFLEEMDRTFMPASMSVQKVTSYEDEKKATKNADKISLRDTPKPGLKSKDIDFSPLNDNRGTKVL